MFDKGTSALSGFVDGAVASAKSRGCVQVAAAQLLLELVEDPPTRQVLVDCGADLDVVATLVDAVVGWHGANGGRMTTSVKVEFTLPVEVREADDGGAYYVSVCPPLG